MKRLIAKADGNHEIVDFTEEEVAAYTAEKEARTLTINISDAKDKAQDILNNTDWTQLPNSGLTEACAAAFVAYRAEVRVIRQSDAVPETWPVAPVMEWA